MNKVEVIKASTNLIDRKKSVSFDNKLRVAAYCRVSTDSEDQLNSYRSQVQHYTDFINSKSEWTQVGIYADEGITGTQVSKREEFQRLINDCLSGKIDMVITKSISRFARNTVDTLNYVRKLKEHNIAVFFEEENINTLSMDGELLLTILSSVAQQEVQNISANVKKGLKMKMQRGELVGFQSCLGYDYDTVTKTISVNEKEAEIVRYIFKRYVEGAGCKIIGKELEQLGYKTRYGYPRWGESTVIGIIKNEKYVGDLLQGKTFTIDPISKRRLANCGEEDKFYLKDHHEPIISRELFEAAHEILKRRGSPRRIDTNGIREKYTRKFSFSCITKCGYCGRNLTRRHWNSSTNYSKNVWQCVSATKGGKKSCPHSKGIEEEIIEKAFVNGYNLIKANDKEALESFTAKLEETLMEDNVIRKIEKIEKEIIYLESKKSKLLDMKLEGTLSKADFDKKYYEITAKISAKNDEKTDYDQTKDSQDEIRSKIKFCKDLLERNSDIEEFDRTIFESIVERVVVGGFDSNGNIDPYLITFVLKIGKNIALKPRKRNSNKESDDDGDNQCHSSSSDLDNLYHSRNINTRGDYSNAISKKHKKYTERVGFDQFYNHFVFNVDIDKSRKETISDYIRISMVIDLDYGNM